MTVPLIDLTRQYESIREEAQSAMDRVLDSQRFILGPEVQALEEEMAEYVGAAHAIGVASGTDALLLSLQALDADPGSAVIVPSFTFFATAGAAWNAGLRPVFCDVDPDTFNVTAETMDAVWTDDTVAVVPVHLFGQMADIGPIRELAASRDAFVLEDAAQAVGASGPGGTAGSAGDACAFSFFPTKNLGAFGDGGMVTTNADEHADKVRKLRVHGGKKMYHPEMVGTNSRLDALQAAIWATGSWPARETPVAIPSCSATCPTSTCHRSPRTTSTSTINTRFGPRIATTCESTSRATESDRASTIHCPYTCKGVSASSEWDGATYRSPRTCPNRFSASPSSRS